MRFEDVYREHVTPVWRYVRLRVPSDRDAEDVVSMVFEKALRSWDAYDADRGSVGGWVTGIARHTVVDWWRKQGRELPTDVVPDGAALDDPEGDALRSVGGDEVRRRLGMLSAREREVVALRFGSELTSEQIGAVLGISSGAARMLLHRAVGRLREVMADER
ncbi:sigma-70 family RNA polymerase sigma factor [Nocardioides panacisoli]|uniref:Sigma-70 family RNA polymerase sigma factor n=1 Tax=Nocardioides panacisoli TaxID=627624 RepID=A0ABP7IPP9_9ACTN